MTEEACGAVIENAWNRETAGRGTSVTQALKGVAEDLQQWSRTSLGDMERRICKLKKDIEACRRHTITQRDGEPRESTTLQVGSAGGAT